jgi:hypothetical protein
MAAPGCTPRREVEQRGFFSVTETLKRLDGYLVQNDQQTQAQLGAMQKQLDVMAEAVNALTQQVGGVGSSAFAPPAPPNAGARAPLGGHPLPPGRCGLTERGPGRSSARTG